MSGTTKQTGVYKITNIVNGKFYIGSTSSKKDGFKDRIKTHTRHLNRGTHCNKHLQSAWNKYGSDNFKFEILEVVEDVNKIIEREQYYIDLFKAYEPYIGYNKAKIAGSQLGYRHTDESKRKMSESQLKIRDETSKRVSESQRGRKHTEEQNLKTSKSLMGNKNSLGKQNRLGQRNSDESIRKMIVAKTGVPNLVKRKKIIQLDLDGKLIKIWDYAGDAEKELKIPRGKISAVCLGNRNSTGGYKWKYLD